mmetsp:Transcript_149/g.186  ORF Transcript_149/g.186 Transcript_149/m.186 type:complete len:231 (+) Transcript_149:101-793(+)
MENNKEQAAVDVVAINSVIDNAIINDGDDNLSYEVLYRRDVQEKVDSDTGWMRASTAQMLNSSTTVMDFVSDDSKDSSMKDSSANNQGDERRRGVQFKSESKIEEVRRISRISTYNLEEITSYWGETDEHALRKSELRSAVRDLYFHRRASDSGFTTLGIDDKVGQGKAAKKINRNLSRNAVMDEQDLQDYEGINDDELLGDIYSVSCEGAKKTAHAKAERLHNDLVDNK